MVTLWYDMQIILFEYSWILMKLLKWMKNRGKIKGEYLQNY